MQLHLLLSLSSSIQGLHYKYFTTAPEDSPERIIIVKMTFHLPLWLKLYKEESEGKTKITRLKNNTADHYGTLQHLVKHNADRTSLARGEIQKFWEEELMINQATR